MRGCNMQDIIKDMQKSRLHIFSYLDNGKRVFVVRDKDKKEVKNISSKEFAEIEKKLSLIKEEKYGDREEILYAATERALNLK